MYQKHDPVRKSRHRQRIQIQVENPHTSTENSDYRESRYKYSTENPDYKESRYKYRESRLWRIQIQVQNLNVHKIHRQGLHTCFVTADHILYCLSNVKNFYIKKNCISRLIYNDLFLSKITQGINVTHSLQENLVKISILVLQQHIVPCYHINTTVRNDEN